MPKLKKHGGGRPKKVRKVEPEHDANQNPIVSDVQQSSAHINGSNTLGYHSMALKFQCLL